MLYITAGEIWYLRILLLHCPAYRFETLLHVDGTNYKSFQAAAVARRLVTNVDEALCCYNDASAFSTPHELRMLFVTLSLQGFATLSIYTNLDSRKLMMLDLIQHSKFL
jgi:hypothetical protein